MTSSSEPASHAELRAAWDDPRRRELRVAAFVGGQRSFIEGLLTEQATELSVAETLRILARRAGSAAETALAAGHTDPARPAAELPAPLRGPRVAEPDGAWLARANVVGVNVRTVGTFFDVVKVALTLPAVHDAIHLLPIWEPGVVGSLYGMASWELNRELFSDELAAGYPWLDTPARQLKATINLLHLLGKSVGLDVIPHTDRFSQITLAFPEHFEWLRREELTIVDHSAQLHRAVQREIVAFLADDGPAAAAALPRDPAALFDDATDEATRLRLLFGEPADHAGRWRRRVALIRWLHRRGLEPVPATMAPPFRGLEVDPSDEARHHDALGLIWRDFRITAPRPMSRVFGPLCRYKLYGRHDDNAAWQIDFSRPRAATWRYVCEHYGAVQRAFGFDFMRGDMSHVQMRPEGVPARIDEHYDLLRAVKRHVRNGGAPHFGYLAESFLAPANVMGYGEEADHLEASEADSALGDLQSLCVDSPEYVRALRRYADLRQTRGFAPSLTVMTADKDDPRFDHFYREGSPLRLFLALLIDDLPSYLGLGFECRDLHLQPAPNEHYSKLYVFHEDEGPHATRGPFVFGKNATLFQQLTRIRACAERLAPQLRGSETRWLLPPDATGEGRLLCWTQRRAPTLLLLAHADLRHAAANVGLPVPPDAPALRHLELAFSSERDVVAADRRPPFNGHQLRLARLAPGECRVYRARQPSAPPASRGPSQ